MNCETCREQLVDYTEGLVDPLVADDMRQHLEGCALCRADATQQSQLHQQLLEAGQSMADASLETIV